MLLIIGASVARGQREDHARLVNKFKKKGAKLAVFFTTQIKQKGWEQPHKTAIPASL